MPVRIRKTKSGYRVTDGGKVTAKGTTKRKAGRQAALLRGLSFGWKPTRRRR